MKTGALEDLASETQPNQEAQGNSLYYAFVIELLAGNNDRALELLKFSGVKSEIFKLPEEKLTQIAVRLAPLFHERGIALADYFKYRESEQIMLAVKKSAASAPVAIEDHSLSLTRMIERFGQLLSSCKRWCAGAEEENDSAALATTAASILTKFDQETPASMAACSSAGSTRSTLKRVKKGV